MNEDTVEHDSPEVKTLRKLLLNKMDIISQIFSGREECPDHNCHGEGCVVCDEWTEYMDGANRDEAEENQKWEQLKDQ